MIKHLNLIFLFSILTISGVYAGKESSYNRLLGTQIQAPNILEVQDNKYPNVTVSGEACIIHSVATLSLRVDNLYNSGRYFGIGLLTVKLSVSGYNSNNTLIGPYLVDLTVNSTTNSAQPYSGNSIYKLENCHKLVATVLDVRDGSGTVLSGLNVPHNLILESGIETERYYRFDPSIAPLITDHMLTPIDLSSNPIDATADELEVNWNYIFGAEEYDLEWTYVNDYKGTITTGIPDTISPNSLIYDFRNNSTRVRVSGNNYRIPLIYDRGYILCRIRGVGRNCIGGDPTITVPGVWTADGLYCSA